MQTLKDLLLHQTFMGPVWTLLVAFVAVPLANELVSKYRGTRAASILQAVALLILKAPGIGRVLARFPVVGDLLYVFAPQDKTGLPTPVFVRARTEDGEQLVPPPPPPAALLLLFAPLLAACTLSQAVANSYRGLTLAESTVSGAMDHFPSAAKAKRLSIVRDAKTEAESRAGLDAWTVTEDRLVKAINGTDATVKMCRDAIAEIRKGLRDKAQLNGWIATGIRLGIDLKDLLEASGLKLGGK